MFSITVVASIAGFALGKLVVACLVAVCSTRAGLQIVTCIDEMDKKTLTVNWIKRINYIRDTKSLMILI